VDQAGSEGVAAVRCPLSRTVPTASGTPILLNPLRQRSDTGLQGLRGTHHLGDQLLSFVPGLFALVLCPVERCQRYSRLLFYPISPFSSLFLSLFSFSLSLPRFSFIFLFYLSLLSFSFIFLFYLSLFSFSFS
jgi:hypothetical protein